MAFLAMRYLLPLLVLSVESGVLGTPIYEGSLEPHKVRDAQNANSVLNVVASCGNSFNLFTTASPSATARPIPDDFDYLSFCSAFNQPTTTSTSFSYVGTTITVNAPGSTITAVTTTTTTGNFGTGTAVATCPIPAPSMICGQGGWGYAANNIYSASGIDPVTCHELCLANSACQSFQVETNATTSPTCNLYKVDPSGNNTIASPAAPFSFFARDCPDHLPAACSGSNAPPPPSSASPSSQHTITVAPPPSSTSSVVIVPPPALTRLPNSAFVERAEEFIPLPWFLQPFGPVTMSAICSCIYTQAIPPTTVVAVIPKATSVYISSPGTVVTALVTMTITVSGGSQYVTSIS